MSKNKVRGIELEMAVRVIAQGLGKHQAAGLVECTNLVEQLAEDLTEEDLESTDSFKDILQDQLQDWDYEDFYNLLKAVRRKKHSAEHEEQTAEKIFQEMQFSARAAANEAVNQLLVAVIEHRLYRFDKAADNTVSILWKIFYCCITDIKESIVRLNKTSTPLSSSDELAHKRLLYFIEVLREKLWERGEVLKLREIE